MEILALVLVIIIGGIAFVMLPELLGNWLINWWQPDFPACNSGKCQKAGDYECLEKEWGKAVYRCRCGEHFVFIARNESRRKFMHRQPDGTLRPYMKRTLIGRWKSDTSA